MNSSMMYKKLLICLSILILAGNAVSAGAVETDQVPEGDILIIYSDGAKESTLEQVEDLVEILTYQSFQVSYAPVSECLSAMKGFSYIICYDIRNGSEAFLKNLKEYEDAGGDNQNGSGHILFAGNHCIKDYFDSTGRSGDYEIVDSSVGKLEYSFDGLTYRTEMVKEDYFFFLKKSLGYQNGSLTVKDRSGYFCAREGVITHIPVTDIRNNLVLAAFIKEAAQWKWPYNGSPAIYAQYIVINQVYPYQDPDKLLQIIKSLMEENTPFVISVMPIYVNGDYPAMEHFCEVLRYAQANGGAVIMNAPINQMTDFDKETLLDYLEQALQVYTGYGVYPLALQVPRNWIFNEDTIEIMSHFRTVFTSMEEDSYIEQSDLLTNLVYKDGHQWVGTAVALDDLGTSYLSAYSTALPVSLEADLEEIQEIIRACRNSSIPLKSLWDMEHSFWTDKDLMTYRNGNLILNGEKIDLSFVPSTYTDDYNYQRNILQRFSKDLTAQNRKLILLVGITSFLFLFFIFLARYRNRRNYFFYEEKDKRKKRK